MVPFDTTDPDVQDISGSKVEIPEELYCVSSISHIDSALSSFPSFTPLTTSIIFCNNRDGQK